MKIDEVELWFGNLYQACIALNIVRSNGTLWRKQRYIPWKQQFRIELFTKGELRADDEDPYLVRHPKKTSTKNASLRNKNDN